MPLADALSSFLQGSAIGERVEQAVVVAEWPRVVGEQIANVTEPRGVTADGTLLVAVRTNSWMSELSLREPEIVAALREKVAKSSVQRIRWILWR